MADSPLRRGLIALLAATVAVVGIGVIVLLLTGDGEEVDEPLAVTTTRPIPSDTLPAAEEPSPEDDEPFAAQPTDGEGEWGEPELVALPPMGIEAVDFDWETVELAAKDSEGLWFHQLLEFNGEMWAIGGDIDWAADAETTLVWASADGISWVPKELPEALASGGTPEFAVTDDGIVAVGFRWVDEIERPQLQVFVTEDGESWVEGDVSALSPRSMRARSWVAASPEGIAVAAGSVEGLRGEPTEPSAVTITKDGYTVTLHDRDWTFTLTDASGEVLLEGSQDVIWATEAQGQGVYDPDSGERVFPLPWEALDEVAVQAFADAVVDQPFVLEFTSSDGTMRIDQFTGELTVTDPSGTVVMTGVEDDIWGGRPPTFIDPETGDVILQITWDDWDAAYDAAYEAGFSDDPDWAAVPVVVVSTDGGLTWDEAQVPEIDVNVYVNGVTYGRNGFLITAGGDAMLDGTMSSRPIVLHSMDGQVWTVLDTNLAGTWISGAAGVGDGYLAVVDAPDEGTISASADGAFWGSILSEEDLELPLGSARFSGVADGPPGTFVLGQRDGWEEPEVTAVEIAKGGRTLTIDQSVYTITDDASGEVLYTFDESTIWDRPDPGTEVTGFRWGMGGLAFFRDDGTLLFTASRWEYDEAMGEFWGPPEVQYQEEPILLYRPPDGDWVSVTMPDLGGCWMSDVAVGADRIVTVVTRETWTASGATSSLSVLIGRSG